MLYICEKCGMVYMSEGQPDECEACGCTYIRKATDNEVANIVGSMLLNGDDTLLKEKEKRDNH